MSVSSIRNTAEGQISLELQREQLKILEAQATYYRSRHPELTSN